MKYFSTFSGIGGFENGIHNAWLCLENKRQTIQRSQTRNTQRQPEQLHKHGDEGLSCVGYSEIDKYAIKVYEKQFGGHKKYGDITTINATELPDFDLLVGGFPCQSFSIAGKRGGFEDTRGTMFFELARILRAKRPRLFVFENVKGLLSHDNGFTFKTIIQTLDELGYDLQWQVLNSKDFGVPQNRERVFIIGHLRGTSRPEVFPFGDNPEAVTQLSGQHSNTLTTRYYGGQANGTYITESKQHAQEIIQLNQPTHSNDRVYGTDGVSPTLNTMQGGNRQPKVLFNKNPSGRGSNGRVMSTNAIAGTLTAGGDNPERNRDVGWNSGYYLDKAKIRRLTPTECERLQGFPDDWTKYGVGDELISDTQRYKMCGNAVTTNVVQAIMERIFK